MKKILIGLLALGSISCFSSSLKYPQIQKFNNSISLEVNQILEYQISLDEENTQVQETANIYIHCNGESTQHMQQCQQNSDGSRSCNDLFVELKAGESVAISGQLYLCREI